MPSHSTISAQDRHFGVEVECYLPHEHCPERNSHLFGLPIAWAPEGWQAKRDGSLVYAPQGYQGVELVSPKLVGEAGLQQVVAVADYVRDELQGCVNATCGLHVHIDASDLTPEQVAQVVALFTQVERHLFALCGEKRQERERCPYCLPVASWPANTARARYRSLNTTNYEHPTSGKQTLEFRLFCGSVDAELIVTAIQACVAVVVKAVNGERIPNARTPHTFLKALTKGALIVPDCPIDDLLLIAALQGQRA